MRLSLLLGSLIGLLLPAGAAEEGRVVPHTYIIGRQYFTVDDSQDTGTLLTSLEPVPRAGRVEGEAKEMFTVEQSPGVVLVRGPDGKPIGRYIVGKLPAGERAPAVDSSCFLHPLYTPSGEIVTDVAPADHPHHRGVFLAWVQMVGRKEADFWGWGARAPKDNRRIVNRQLRVVRTTATGATLEAENDWNAEGETLVKERCRLRFSRRAAANVVDLEFRLESPAGEVRIEPSAFGGFCYRAKPRGNPEVGGAEGLLTLPNSAHDRPATDWPAAKWYDMTYRPAGESVAGVAVLDHPDNPVSRWHVHRGIHMLNPCIVADGPVSITPARPLVLRYQLVAHDGPPDAAFLNDLHRAWTAR